MFRMKPTLRLTLLSAALVALLAGCNEPAPTPQAAQEPPAAQAPAAPQREVNQYDIETLRSSHRLIGAALSPDGSKVLYSSNQSGVINIHEVAVAGGEPKALTTSTTDSLYAIGYFPNDERVVYTA